MLMAGGVCADAIVTATSLLVNREDLARDIAKSARSNGCGTIVVDRKSFSWIQEIFRGHIADQLVQESGGLSVSTVL